MCYSILTVLLDIYIVISLSVRSFCVFIEWLIKPRFFNKSLTYFESQKRHKFMLLFYIYYISGPAKQKNSDATSIQSPTSGLRLGLSRNMKLKPLHPNLKVQHWQSCFSMISSQAKLWCIKWACINKWQQLIQEPVLTYM